MHPLILSEWVQRLFKETMDMNSNTATVDYAAPAWGYSAGAREATVIPLPAFANRGIDGLRLHEFVKRLTDVTGALLGIVVTLPLWALIALAVKLTSRGPVFFTQERAGVRGQPFRMFKFRTMVVDAEARLKELVQLDDLSEPVYKLADDPRVTRVGRFLRRFGLDELPQLLNVLRGEMSLVGPRPEVLALASRYNAEQQRRLLIKPGITGYQQINNRGMPDMAARLAYDIYYLRHRSMRLDLWILIMTIFVIASGKEITY
jgi:lipopolysaccharide/colanic/teichoic acid biosynthesis glycosyltransferase